MPSDGGDSPRGGESDRERSLDYSERSPSRSPVRRHSRSRSRSPARDAAPAAGGGSGAWREALEALYSKGSVRRGDLDERTLADIDALREDEASCVITRLDETDLTRIRNVNGFVGGIIRRVKTDGPDRGEANVGVLPPEVQKQLDELVEDRKLERREVDHRMVRALSELKEGQAEEALRRFATSVDDTIRSRQGFLMGIVKRMNDNGRGRPPPSRYGGGGGGGRDRGDRGGSRYDDRRDDRRDSRGYEPRGPPPSRGGGGYDRYDDRRGGGGGGDRRYDDRRAGGYDDRRGSGGYEPRGPPPLYEPRGPPPPRDYRGGPPPPAYEPRGGYEGGRYGDRPRY